MTNAVVILTPGMDAEHACRLLKKAMLRASVFQDMRRHEHHVKPGEQKRLKQKRARAKLRKAERKRESFVERYEDVY